MNQPLRPDEPTPGCRAVRWVKGGPVVACRIMCADGLWVLVNNGHPSEASANGWAIPGMEWANFSRQITEADYAALLVAAAEAAPQTPLADPKASVDLRRSPSLW